ncbi:MAG: outer membrane beta-barrel protein [Myxococcales bacterium]
MNRLPLAALLLASAPAFSAGLASRSADDWDSKQSSLEGLYAALGGGGMMLYKPGDNAFGYDGEVRIGYSFNPMLQLYLSGALDGATFSGATIRIEQIVAFLQYHLLVKPALMVYGRAGIGLGLSGDLGSSGSTATGVAEAAGIGVEIRVAPDLFLAPEVFYRNTNLATGGTETRFQSAGFQLSVVYY